MVCFLCCLLPSAYPTVARLSHIAPLLIPIPNHLSSPLTRAPDRPFHLGSQDICTSRVIRHESLPLAREITSDPWPHGVGTSVVNAVHFCLLVPTQPAQLSILPYVSSAVAIYTPASLRTMVLDVPTAV